MIDLSQEMRAIEMSVCLDRLLDLDDPLARRSAYIKGGIDDKSISSFDDKALKYAKNTRKLFGEIVGKAPS